MIADLPPCDYPARLPRLRERLDGSTVIVSATPNLHWLTGFVGSLGWLVVGPQRAVLITDGRYGALAADTLERTGLAAVIDVDVHRSREALRQAIVDAASAPGGGAVLAEDGDLTHAAWMDWAHDLELQPAGGLVTALRRSKDAGEIARIRRAAEIADAALVDVAALFAEEPTEMDVRDELEYRMRKLGADGPSYDTIVSSGPNHAAQPHYRCGRRTIVEGDLVIIDVGALVDEYHSDMTRTIVVGEPNAEQTDTYELVRQSQAAGVAAVGPGVAVRDVDAAARDVFVRAGVVDDYLHNTGHGVGLLIHEDPFATPLATDTLVVGDVVTVEPGLYRGGFGGVRIEDLLVVTDSGAEALTHLPKDAPCLPSPPTT